MSDKYSYLFLAASIFTICFMKTGKWIDSFGYAASISYLIVFFIVYFKPIKVVVNNQNDFTGAKVELKTEKNNE